MFYRIAREFAQMVNSQNSKRWVGMKQILWPLLPRKYKERKKATNIFKYTLFTFQWCFVCQIKENRKAKRKWKNEFVVFFNFCFFFFIFLYLFVLKQDKCRTKTQIFYMSLCFFTYDAVDVVRLFNVALSIGPSELSWKALWRNWMPPSTLLFIVTFTFSAKFNFVESIIFFLFVLSSNFSVYFLSVTFIIILCYILKANQFLSLFFTFRFYIINRSLRTMAANNKFIRILSKYCDNRKFFSLFLLIEWNKSLFWCRYNSLFFFFLSSHSNKERNENDVNRKLQFNHIYK